MNKMKSLAVVTMVGFVSACGSGGNGSSADTNDNTNNNTGTTETATVQAISLYLELSELEIDLGTIPVMKNAIELLMVAITTVLRHR